MPDDRDLAQPAEAVELHPVEPDDSAMALVAALGAAEDARAAIDEAIDTLQTSMGAGGRKLTLVESMLALTRVAKRLCGDYAVEIQVTASSKEVEELGVPREGWVITRWDCGTTASIGDAEATLVINKRGGLF